MVVVTGESDRWQARDGADPIGVLCVFTRPDQRTFLSFRDCRDDAYAPLLTRALTALPGRRVYTSVPEQDERGRRRLEDLGFMLSRREHHYRIPVDPARFRMPGLPPPPEIAVISAADADLDRLRVLDDRLRNDTPGSDGWRWSPSDFREETSSDGFNPATYQVAVDKRDGAYVGVARLWMKEAGPRFGFVGVLPPWRRTRVTYVLLSIVFAAVHRLGYREVAGEIDVTNRASNAIAARAGALRVGGSYELLHEPFHQASPDGAT